MTLTQIYELYSFFFFSICTNQSPLQVCSVTSGIKLPILPDVSHELFVSISPQAWLTGVIAGWSIELCLSVPLCLATRLQYLSLCYLWCLQPVSTTRKSQRICGWLLSLPFLNMPQSNSPQHFLVNCRRIIIAEIPQQPLHFTLG